MKICPECQYRNPDSWDKCEVCGANVKTVAVGAEPRENRASPRRSGVWLVSLAVVSAVGAGVLVYSRFFQSAAPRQAAQPSKTESVQEQNAVEQDASDETPAYGGDTVAILRSMSELKMPGEEEVSLLLRSFEADSSAVRAQAAATTADWAVSGVAYFPDMPDKLLSALSDTSHVVRAQAADAMQRVLSSPGAKSASGFSAALRDEKFSARLYSAVDAILKGGYSDARAAGAALAGDIGGSRWKEPLAKLAQDDGDIASAMQAAGALAKIGDARGVKRLLALFDSSDEDTREVAARLLASSSDARADGALRRLAVDNNARVRHAAKISIDYRRREPGATMFKGETR